MKAAIPIEERHLALITGKPEVEEAFDSAVFFFSDGTYEEVKSQSSPKPLDPRAPGILKDLRDKLRKDRTFGDIGNVEAELLGELYNPKRAGSFRAYFHGKRNTAICVSSWSHQERCQPSNRPKRRAW